ncbi:MAG: hypothetical protein GX958_07025 [Desulfitobacterium sp.]|nr:hypothetical protein [Desulfitobacterium sp.]
MRKMDEMELSISLKAIRIAYAYSVIFLFIWWLYDYLKTGFNSLPFILLITQNLILLGSQTFLKWKMGR